MGYVWANDVACGLERLSSPRFSIWMHRYRFKMHFRISRVAHPPIIVKLYFEIYPASGDVTFFSPSVERLIDCTQFGTNETSISSPTTGSRRHHYYFERYFVKRLGIHSAPPYSGVLNKSDTNRRSVLAMNGRKVCGR